MEGQVCESRGGHKAQQLPSFATFLSVSTGGAPPFPPASASSPAGPSLSIPLMRSSSSSSSSSSSHRHPTFSSTSSSPHFGGSGSGNSNGTPTSQDRNGGSCASPICTNPAPYAGMPPPSTAGDRFRGWFPSADRLSGSSTTDLRAYKTSRTGPFVADRKYNTSPAVPPLPCDQPRRISLPSFTSLTTPSPMSEGRRNSHVDVPETAATTALALPSSRSSITGYGAPGFSSGFKAAGMLDSTRQGSHHHAGGRHILPTSRIRSSSPGAGMLTPDQIPEALSLTLALASRGALPPALSGDRRGSADSTSSQEKGLSRNKRKAGAMSTAKCQPKDGSGDESEGSKRFKCPHDGCGKSYSWKENLTRHMTTWHSPMQNRCPFCKDNAMRPSFNRLDNFKEHILRHFRDRNNCRARTGFDPAAEEFYLGITEMVKQRRQQQQHQQHMGMSTTAAQRKRLADHMNAAESPGSTDTCDTGSDAASDVDGDVGMMG